MLFYWRIFLFNGIQHICAHAHPISTYLRFDLDEYFFSLFMIDHENQNASLDSAPGIDYKNANIMDSTIDMDLNIPTCQKSKKIENEGIKIRPACSLQRKLVSHFQSMKQHVSLLVPLSKRIYFIPFHSLAFA